MSKISQEPNPFESPIKNKAETESNNSGTAKGKKLALHCIFFSFTGSALSLFIFALLFLLGVVLLNQMKAMPITKLENFGQFGFLLLPIAGIGAVTGISCFLVPLFGLRLWFLTYLAIPFLLFFCCFKKFMVELPDVVFYSFTLTCFLAAIVMTLPMKLLQQVSAADIEREKRKVSETDQ